MNRAWVLLNIVLGIQFIGLVVETIRDGYSWVFTAIALLLILILNLYIYDYMKKKKDTNGGKSE